MPSWKKIIVSGSDASLNSLYVSNGITGSLLGTASYVSTLRATGSNTEVQFNNNGLLGSNSRFYYDKTFGVLTVVSSGSSLPTIQFGDINSDGGYLGSNNNSSNENGLFSSNSDQTIASFDSINNYYRYSNNNYYYDAGNVPNTHYFIGNLDIDGNTSTIGSITASGGFLGNLTGIASTASAVTVQTETGGATHYVYFGDSSTGTNIIKSNTNLTFVPSANTLLVSNIFATSVTASLHGTASWAIQALTASYVNPLSQSLVLTGSFYFASESNDSNIYNVDRIFFDYIADHSPTTTGELVWNQGDSTLEFGLSGSVGTLPTLKIGEQTIARVYNDQGTTITKGQVVFISGSQGNRIAVKLASATAEYGSANTLGFVLDDIPNGNEGYISTGGPLYGLNTIGLVAGQLIYLSSSAGEYTQTPPTSPLHTVRLGFVERVHASAGSIYVKIDNGYELDELHDVLITNALSGDLITRSGSLWINSKTLTGSYTLSGSLTTNDGISVQTLTASFVSASSGITGSLLGTASFATNANQLNGQNASYYLNASNINAGTLSNSYLPSQISVTGVTASFTGSLIGSLTGTASWATNAISASFLPVGTYQITSSWAQTSSQALTASYTPNALITASVSTNVLTFTKGDGSTFNLTVNTGSGGGVTSIIAGTGISIDQPTGDVTISSTAGSPGGSTYDIQFNNGAGGFGGSSNFTHDGGGYVKYTTNQDWGSTTIDESDISRVRLYNSLTTVNNEDTQSIDFKADLIPWTSITPPAATTTITTFTPFVASLSGLKVTGFKCDYCLMYHDEGVSNKIQASRTGVLLGAWDYDTSHTPVISDSFVSGENIDNRLQDAIFTLTWNSNVLELKLDTTNVNIKTVFSGLFTVFTNRTV